MAEVWLRSFAAALPTVRLAHTDDEVRRWVREELVVRPDTWVASRGDAIAGVMALSPGWIDTLYLDPDARGQGIGDRFVALAQERQPGGLQLWTFQVNGPAQRVRRPGAGVGAGRPTAVTRCRRSGAEDDPRRRP